MYNTKQVETMKVASSFLTNDCKVCFSQNYYYKKKKKLTIATAIFDDKYNPQSLFDNKLYFYDFATCTSELTTKTSLMFTC